MYKRFITSILLLSTLPCYAQVAPTIFGAYQVNAQTMSPLILKKDNQGIWQQVSAVAGLPTSMQNLNITSADCSALGCIAMGSYSFKGKATRSLLLTSADGLQWQSINQISGMPDTLNSTDALLLQTKCDDSACIVAGYTRHPDHSMGNPLLFSTQGNTSTWQTADVKGMPAMQGGYLRDIEFSNNNAIVLGGYYQIQDEWKSLMLISHDHGSTWEINQSIAGLPKHFVDYGSIECVDNHCVIAARDVTNDSQSKPAFLTSDDNGNTWRYVTNLTLPSSFYNGSVFAMKCQKTSCIAFGEYFSSPKDHSIPFILTSNDSGNSWNAVKNPAKLPLDTIQIIPVNISCLSDTNCIIQTSYITQASEDRKPQAHPLLFNGTLKDGSWDFTRIDANLPMLNSLILISAGCTSDECTVVGAFKQTENAADFSPVIFTSDDAGTTWTVASPLTIPSSSYFDLVM